MILRNHVTFWWGKKGEAYSVSDDMRFVIGRYRAGGPWVTQRLCYALAVRYGIALRIRRSGDWNFFGYLRLKSLGTTNEADTAKK